MGLSDLLHSTATRLSYVGTMMNCCSILLITPRPADLRKIADLENLKTLNQTAFLRGGHTPTPQHTVSPKAGPVPAMLVQVRVQGFGRPGLHWASIFEPQGPLRGELHVRTPTKEA